MTFHGLNFQTQNEIQTEMEFACVFTHGFENDDNFVTLS